MSLAMDDDMGPPFCPLLVKAIRVYFDTSPNWPARKREARPRPPRCWDGQPRRVAWIPSTSFQRRRLGGSRQMSGGGFGSSS